MTKTQISCHDIELLSIYLDGQLNSAQQVALEARLHTQPALARELEALRNTRQMLRALPPLRAPRNFTLSAQAYRKPASTRLPSFFGAVSALSSALLVLLVIASMLLDRGAQPVSLAGEQAYPVALEASAPTEDITTLMQAKVPEETEAMDSYPAPVTEEISRIAEPTPELLTVPPAAEESQLVLEPTATPVLEEAVTLGIQEAATATPYPTQEMADSSSTTLPYEVALPGITVGVSGGEATQEDASAKNLAETPTTPRSPLTKTLQTGEIILAGCALLTGLIALVIFIRQRK